MSYIHCKAASDFQLFNNLPLLLFAVIAGVTSVSGALLGGVLLHSLDAQPRVSKEEEAPFRAAFDSVANFQLTTLGVKISYTQGGELRCSDARVEQ